MKRSLADILKRLEAQYGSPGTLPVSGPLEMILWENVAYLVNDLRRKAAFESLKERIGLSPQNIHSASKKSIRKALEGGGIILPERVKKLASIGKIVMDEFGGDLNQVLDFPTDKAMKALQLFPGVGRPGAEKILMFSRRLPVLALESNGLRALIRLGYGQQKNSYNATYISTQAAVRGELIEDYDWLIRAHQLLRIHGQELCKRTIPRCKDCPLLMMCDYAAEQGIVARPGARQKGRIRK